MLTKHHVYPKKWRTVGKTEIKLVTPEEHNAWNLLVGDLHPAEAMKLLAIKFLPTELENRY